MRLVLGPAQVRDVLDGEIWLDGGAMYGVVPKALWSRADPPDAENRVRLALRPMLIRVDDRVILVDTGAGRKWSDKDRARYRIGPEASGLLAALAEEGIDRADVTDVVLTHLHFDHAGGTTLRGANGELELTFPSARHFLQRRNLAHALAGTSRDRASYLRESFEPLLSSRLLRLLDGPVEIASGVDVVVADGHTAGQQLVRVRDPRPGGAWLLFAADEVPTRGHVPLSWVMGYDLCPELTMREKARLLSRAAAEGGVIFLEHDPGASACTVTEDTDGRIVVRELIP